MATKKPNRGREQRIFIAPFRQIAPRKVKPNHGATAVAAAIFGQAPMNEAGDRGKHLAFAQGSPRHRPSL